MIKRPVILAAALLGLGVLAVYFQTGSFGLINCDDYEYLVRSTAVTGGCSREGWKWAWGGQSLEHAIWMPLTWVSYMLDFTLFGNGGWGAMHLHSVALHALNSLLLFALFLILLNRTGQKHPVAFAFLAALFWALHPLRVESVAWLASRKDVLSLSCELGAMICWVASLSHRSDSGRFCLLYISSMTLFCLGALAKPSVMTFPILQLCLDVFILKRVRPRMYIVPCILMILIGIEAAYAQAAGGATGDLGQVPLFWRILNAMSSYGIYLVNSILPISLAPQCMIRFPELPRGLFAGLLFSLVAAGYACYRLIRLWLTRRTLFKQSSGVEMAEWTASGDPDWFLAGLLWFSLGIGPMLGIASFGYHAYCDRFTYIPAIGLSLILISVARRFNATGKYVFLCVVLAMGLLAYRQVGFWQSERALWTQTIAVDGESNAVARIGLGIAAFEIDHDLDVCCAELQRVREINEGTYWNCVQVHIYALCELGRMEEAEGALSWFRQAHDAYAASHMRIQETPIGPVEVPVRLTNFTDAEIAVAICDEMKRPWAEREIASRCASSRMTPSLAYLMYRLAIVTNNDKLRRKALDELSLCAKTDFLQFRYLTQKEK